MMKVLFFTDTHGHIEALDTIKEQIKEEGIDLAVCSGDLTVFENDMHKLLRRVNSFGIPVLMMPGNHESEETLSEACIKYRNIRYTNNEIYETDELLMILIEGNGFAFIDKDFEKKTKKLAKRLAKSRNKKRGLKYVLVTHAVPYNTKLDFIFGEHVGNKSIRNFIRKTRPIYAICGHLHENEGKRDKLGKTEIHNPGMYGKVFEF